MKAGWESKKLGDVCQIARGGSPRPIQEFMTNEPDGVNWVKISDATASGKFIYATKEKIKPSGVARSRLVKPGDFLLSNSMSFGRPYIMQTSGCIHDGWLVLSEYEKSFEQSFLYYLLSSPVVFEQFDRLAAGSTVRNLNIDLASRVELPIPPLPEQQRIVAILELAFAAIATARAHAEQNLKNARAVFDSHLQAVFSQRGDGWVGTTLGRACQIARGGSPRPIQEFITNEPDGVNWIKISDATASGKFIYATKEKIKPSGVARSRLVKPGDFLLSNSMSFGRPYIMQTSGCIHDGWLVLSEYEKSFDQDFLYYLLGSSVVFEQFDRLAAGSTVRNLNIDLASRVELPAPSLPEQRYIATQLDTLREQTQALASLYQRKIAALDALKQSLLHQAFSGAL